MSVKNAKTGALPHGWLEYTDERSGRAYYYNVHTKVHMTHLPPVVLRWWRALMLCHAHAGAHPPLVASLTSPSDPAGLCARADYDLVQAEERGRIGGGKGDRFRQ